MKKEIDTSVYWDLNRTLTHNCLFNFIVGNRGGGKSFGCKRYVIDRFIKYKEQFGYIRRYKGDLTDSMKEFFSDVAPYYPEYEFKATSKYLYIRLRVDGEENVKWTEEDIAGYGFVLATADNRKSISYPRITTLIYDEALLKKGNVQYIDDEATKLLDMYETVARPGTDHPRVILFLLANAISITNPYFLFWDLKMPKKKDGNGKLIWKHPTRSILVEDVQKEEFIKRKRATEFGGIIAGTSYEGYSIDNKFILDDDKFIEKKTANAKYFFTFTYKEHSFGVWVDIREGKMFVSKSIDPSYPLVYSITMKDHRPNTMFLKNKSRAGCFKSFIENYKLGNVYFESINIKNISYEVIKLSLSI